VRDELEKLFRHSAIFLVGLIFQRAARFFLLPLYWSVFPPAQFGLLDLFDVFIWVMTLTFSFALPSAYVKFHRIDVKEGVAAEILQGTTLVLSIGGIVLLGLVMASFQSPLSWLFFGGRYPLLYAIAGGAVVANIASLMLQSTLRAQGRAVTYTLLSSVQFLLLMFFNIYFIKIRGMGLEGVLWSTVLGGGIPALAYGAINVRSLRWQFDSTIARRLFHFALPLVPVTLVSFFLVASGRLFLQHFRDLESVGPEAVGILATANRVALILMLVSVTPFQTAWGYLGLDCLRRPDAREILSRVFTYLLLIGLWTFLLVSTVGREVILLFGKGNYLLALPYVDPLAAGYLMLLFFYWANIVLVGRNMTGQILLISLAPFAIALVGGWLAIPRHGVGGACAVFLTAMAVHAGLTAVVGNHLLGFTLEKVRVGKILLAFAIPYGLGQQTFCIMPGGRLATGFAQIVAFPLLLWAFGFLTHGEMARLRDLRSHIFGSLSGES